MPDVPPAGSPPVPPVTPDAGNKPTGTPEPEGNAGERLTKSEVERMIAERDATWQKRLDGQSATISRLEKLVKHAEPLANQTPTNEPKPQLGLDERLKELEVRDQKQRERAVRQEQHEARQQIQRALSAHNLAPEHAARAAKLIQMELGPQVKVVEADDGDFKVVVAADGQDVPVDSYIGKFLQTDEGRFYLPTTRNPQVPGSSTATAFAKVRATKADLAAGKVKPEDIQSGKVEIIE